LGGYINKLLKGKYFFNNTSDLAYDKYGEKLFLLGQELGNFFQVNQFGALIFKELEKVSCFEDFYKSKVVMELNSPQESILIHAKIKFFIEHGFLSVERPFTEGFDRYQLEYTFVSEEGESQVLIYRTYASSMANKWGRLLYLQNETDSKRMNNGVIFSRFLGTSEELFQKLKVLNDKVISFLSKVPSIIDDTFLIKNPVLNQSCLNRLHLVFEKLYNHKELEGCNSFNQILRDFNMTIHQCEEAISQNEGALVELVHEKAIGPIRLTEIEKGSFSTKLNFGDVYLNYLQIGHSMIGAFECDSDSFPEKQEFYNANHFLCFRPDSEFSQMDGLTNWAREKFEVDISKENWCLGHIPLAELYETHEFTVKNINVFLKKYPTLESIQISTVEDEHDLY
jgi:hypothetical protein